MSKRDFLDWYIPFFVLVFLLSPFVPLKDIVNYVSAAEVEDPCSENPPPNTTCINWLAPTENIDGTQLTDLSGYEIWYDTKDLQMNLRNNPRQACDPDFLHSGKCIHLELENQSKYVFDLDVMDLIIPSDVDFIDINVAMTAYNSESQFSSLSNQVTKTIQIQRGPFGKPVRPVIRFQFIPGYESGLDPNSFDPNSIEG